MHFARKWNSPPKTCACMLLSDTPSQRVARLNFRGIYSVNRDFCVVSFLSCSLLESNLDEKFTPPADKVKTMGIEEKFVHHKTNRPHTQYKTTRIYLRVFGVVYENLRGCLLRFFKPRFCETTHKEAILRQEEWFFFVTMVHL